MKHLALFLVLSLAFASLNAQLKNVKIEKYYISDANDAKDIQYFTDDIGNTTDTVVLEEGSITYRIYIQITAGYVLTKVYGDANHALKFASTANFYNHSRGTTFGKDMKKTLFKTQKTLPLDSWLAISQATTTDVGVIKTTDKNGSFVGGTNSGGYLVNKDTAAGIPLTTSDGLMPVGTLPTGWLAYGIVDNASGNDSTIFGSLQPGNQFSSNLAFIQNSGMMGVDTLNDNVLIAQLTTKGDISFELNIQLKKLADNTTINYVAKRSPVDQAQGNVYSQLLSYPQVPVCGCKDPNFIEYNPNLDCNIQDSCKTPIVLGCMDPQACNYDPNANMPVKSMCCYPGSCSDRDISVVCPDLGNKKKSTVLVYPNPVNNQLSIEVNGEDIQDLKLEIYNSFGKLIAIRNPGTFNGSNISTIDMSGFENGIYLVKYSSDEFSGSKLFLKN